MKAIVWL